MNNFPPFEVVDRGSETQPQVVENLNKITHEDKGEWLFTTCHLVNVTMELKWLMTEWRLCNWSKNSDRELKFVCYIQSIVLIFMNTFSIDLLLIDICNLDQSVIINLPSANHDCNSFFILMFIRNVIYEYSHRYYCKWSHYYKIIDYNPSNNSYGRCYSDLLCHLYPMNLKLCHLLKKIVCVKVTISIVFSCLKYAL